MALWWCGQKHADEICLPSKRKSALWWWEQWRVQRMNYIPSNRKIRFFPSSLGTLLARIRTCCTVPLLVLQAKCAGIVPSSLLLEPRSWSRPAVDNYQSMFFHSSPQGRHAKPKTAGCLAKTSKNLHTVVDISPSLFSETGALRPYKVLGCRKRKCTSYEDSLPLRTNKPTLVQ